MDEQTFLENPCEVCGGTNYILDMGFYACTECQTLSQVNTFWILVNVYVTIRIQVIDRNKL